MSDAFVDVSWRGLEVGRRIKLRAVRAGDACLDHTTPMPVGTQVSIRTDEGYEIPVTVIRVHEQVGGSNEVPGMQIVPRAMEGAAQAWWAARVEADAATATATAAAPAAAAAAAVASPAALFGAQADPRADITSRPTLTMSTVEVNRALAASAATELDEARASSTDVMAAVIPDATDNIYDGVVETSSSDDGLVDDGRRTMAMSAVDISAIVQAAETETSGGVSSEDDSGGNSTGAGATSKKKKPAGGKRSKRR